LTLSQSTLSVTAATFTPAPTRTITISLENFFVGSDPVIVGGTFSSAGIATPSLSQGGAGTVILSIPFKDPTVLGPGTYTDQILIRACHESPCVNHINGSPKAISITYIVTSNASPPTVSFSGSTVEVSYDNVGSVGTRIDDSIQYSIANPGTDAVFSRVTVAGDAVVAGATVWNGTSQGKVRITLREPGALVAGTYTGTVRVDLCRDPECTIPLPGSPGNIAVTYQVTGSAFPNTQTQWSIAGVPGTLMVTNETRSPLLRLGLRVTNPPPNGLFIRRTPSATGLIAGAFGTAPSYITKVAGADSQYDLTLKAPASLGSGIFSDTMTFEACFDEACAQVVPGSNYTLAPTFMITATEDVEYTRRVVHPGGTADSVVWSPVDGSLYVAATSSGTARIVQVNPVTGSTGLTAQLPVGDIRSMAVTQDGSYLYAGSVSKQTLTRLLLPSLAPDLSIQLGERDSSTPFATGDLQTIAGQPRSVVVAVGVTRTGEHAGVRVYDDAVARAMEVGPTSPASASRWLVPAAEAGQFISWRKGTTVSSNALERLSVDASGIHVDSSITLPLDRNVGGHPLRVDNKLYHSLGSILDATTGEVLGTIPMPPNSTAPIAVLPDARNRRLFVWVQVRGAPVMVSYDLDTLQILAYLPMDFGSGSMVLWGNEGVAITNGSSVTLLSGPFFSSYRGEPRQ
jgi:hypothetical protein